jgi:hypothetical protein
MHDLICMMKFIRNLISSRNTIVSGQKPAATLHIGVEKTGSTTIQEFLHLNRQLLAKQGIWFPGFFGKRNHHQLAVYCNDSLRSNQFTRPKGIDDPESFREWKERFRISFQQEMEKHSGQHNHILFSSEHFSSQLKDTTEIARLKNMLDDYVSSYTVIIYIRRQDLLASSMISNSARVGLSTGLPTGSEICARHFYNYRRLLKKWSEVFGKENIRLRIFEKEQLINQDLVQDFMQQAGIRQDEKFRLPQRMNTSLSATAIEAAWLFNQKFPIRNGRSDIQKINKLRLELISEIIEKYPGPGKMLLKDDARDFLNIYKKTNQKVAAEWFGREKLFSEDFSMYPEQEQIIDQPPINQIVNEFIAIRGLDSEI